MKLIYRATTLNFEPQSLPAYRQPHAINWRYQILGESYDIVPQVPVYRQPCALNWRYCSSC